MQRDTQTCNSSPRTETEFLRKAATANSSTERAVQIPPRGWGKEAATNLSLPMLPQAHVSKAFQEPVKRRFQKVVTLMSTMLPPSEARVHICSSLNHPNCQMSELEATSA